MKVAVSGATEVIANGSYRKQKLRLVPWTRHVGRCKPKLSNRSCAYWLTKAQYWLMNIHQSMKQKTSTLTLGLHVAVPLRLWIIGFYCRLRKAAKTVSSGLQLGQTLTELKVTKDCWIGMRTCARAGISPSKKLVHPVPGQESS